MKASEEVKKFIKGYEGKKLEAYRCPAGVWTIGYGHTGSDVKPGMKISEFEAGRLFDQDLDVFERQLTDLLHANRVEGLRQNQFDALLSFAYNVGMGNLRRSTLWRKVKTNVSDPTIAGEFGKWVYAAGIKLRGLEKRRAAEAEMWRRVD